jgi:MarR family transcriptional regulator for hemolysin
MTQPPDPQQALTLALQPTRQAWLRAAGLIMAGEGLSTTVAIPVLLVSRLGDGVTQQVLAERIGIHPAALVRTLDQAEQAQLLERRVVPGNRRQRAIHLLPEGQRVAASMERKLRKLRAELMEDVPAGDLEAAVRVLAAFEERARRYAESSR